ncbi:Dihydroorotase, mitochondrial [Capsicum chinense]|nr:Dihydroorotase, mitochondrial [Capsicum chinense]
MSMVVKVLKWTMDIESHLDYSVPNSQTIAAIKRMADTTTTLFHSILLGPRSTIEIHGVTSSVNSKEHDRRANVTETRWDCLKTFASTQYQMFKAWKSIILDSPFVKPNTVYEFQDLELKELFVAHFPLPFLKVKLDTVKFLVLGEEMHKESLLETARIDLVKSLVHGEVTNPEVDMFDREKVFIETILRPLVLKFPRLKVVMEHVTTMDAVNFVESCNEGFVAATVTPQHLVLNRNSLFQGGLQPHNFCLPVLKREIHRQALVSAVTRGSKRFFLGTDSAPHDRRRKECSCGCAGIYNAPVALSVYAKVFEKENALDKLEAFTSFNGPDFYGLPRNNSKIKLSKTPWKVPESFSYASGDIVPMFAGEMLDWLPSPL